MKAAFQWLKWLRLMGPRYVLFRTFYELKKKSGYLKKLYPVDPPFQSWITLADWRNNAQTFFFDSRETLPPVLKKSQDLRHIVDRIKNGEVHFFSGEWKTMDLNDWHTNISTGHVYDKSTHWTQIPDFHPTYGDIKYVWEKSRFSFIQPILRFDHETGEDSSSWVFSQIESWIDHNPVNRGPNFVCSQEISFRTFNWILALYFYRHSSSLTSTLFSKIIFAIYWQTRHVRTNINFSRIAVRNNHAISESLILYTVGSLFPFFEGSTEWKASGKKWFEREILYQIYDDGSYLQFSFNYQRLVAQLLTWGISLASHNQERFNDGVYKKALSTLKLLMTCQDEISGRLPNYGANDGTLLFNWNDTNFQDYRPALNALHALLTKSNLYSGTFNDAIWFGIQNKEVFFSPITIQDGTFSFDQGGIYVYRKDEVMLWINCVAYKDRPSQADNLHIDLWVNGRNLLHDSGSYRYNTDPSLTKYFSGTESHNTVMVEHADQMLKGPRFIWLNWPRTRQAGWETNSSSILFNGKIQVFKHLGNIEHNRTVMIEPDRLIVTDHLSGLRGQTISQLWHTDENLIRNLEITSLSGVSPKQSVKYLSPTYGVLNDALQIEFTTDSQVIKTQILFS